MDYFGAFRHGDPSCAAFAVCLSGWLDDAGGVAVHPIEQGRCLCRVGHGAVAAAGCLAALLQTETLTLAIVIWFFAEILLSFAQRRIRTIPIALAIVIATFLRLDGIALCIPAVIAAVILHSPREAMRQSAMAAVIVLLPLAGWTVRNLAVGISVFPSPLVLPDNAPTPYGYMKWGGTWITEEYQRMGWAWPVNSSDL